MPIQLYYHLLPKINSIIRQLFEFGLIERWDKLSRTIGVNAKLFTQNSDKHSNLVVLTVDHILGAILIMFIGHILAIISFIMEIYVYRQIKNRNFKQIWITLHKILHPYNVNRL